MLDFENMSWDEVAEIIRSYLPPHVSFTCLLIEKYTAETYGVVFYDSLLDHYLVIRSESEDDTEWSGSVYKPVIYESMVVLWQSPAWNLELWHEQDLRRIDDILDEEE